LTDRFPFEAPIVLIEPRLNYEGVDVNGRVR
jgi:hypothetical protein